MAVEDCALANVCAMKSDVVDENYNVGTGMRTSLLELAEMLLELTGCEKSIQFEERSQATLVKNRIGDPQKATKEINFSSEIDLKEGLKRLIDWRNDHHAGVLRRQRDAGIL